MKVLILDDERYERLMALEGLPKSKRPKSVELPDAQELHRMARNGETPAEFTAARERLEAVNEAAENMRERMHELIALGYQLGVRPSALQKWSGYSARRIHQITK